MTTLKVGDRVVLRGTVAEVDDTEYRSRAARAQEGNGRRE